MVKRRVRKITRRSWRYSLKRGRLHFYLFYFSRVFNTLNYKFLHYFYKSNKHTEQYLLFYFSKMFLQLNPKKIFLLPIFNWYKHKYYNISDFYEKYSKDTDNFYYFSFLKKYFYKWKNLQNKYVYWNAGFNSILFLKDFNTLDNDSIEEKLEEIDENYINQLEVKNFNYLNFYFEIDDLDDFKNSIEFSFLEKFEKLFFLEYYKIFTLLVLNKSFKF